jgi:uncharacterized RDD family membrane protein YckC
MHPIADLVNHFVEVTDVDGVIRRIDVNDVVERIDVNKLVQRIDFNEVLSKIDWNAQLNRVDLDQLLKRVNTNELIARSSTGVMSTFLDAMRLQLTMMDLYLRIVTRCLLWNERHRQQVYLPPRPGRHRQRNDRKLYPKGRTNKAIAVQGRYCGFVSKAVSILMDVFTITLLFAMVFRVAQWCLVLFLGLSKDEAQDKTKGFQSQDAEAMLLMFCGSWFMYFFLSVGLAGQTLGMAIVGVKVCNCSRAASPYSTVTMKQAFLRTCVLPATITLCPPLGVIGLVRRDGRMLHDLVANTGMIYLWNAKLTKLRSEAMKHDQGRSAFKDDDTSDELDDILLHVIDENASGSPDRLPNSGSTHDQDGLLRRTHESSQYSTFDGSAANERSTQYQNPR